MDKQKNEVYLVYRTDCNHTKKSNVLLGVFTCQKKLIKHCRSWIKKQAKEDYEEFEPDYKSWQQLFHQEVDLFFSIGQTQGFSSNLIKHTEPLNKLIDVN